MGCPLGTQQPSLGGNDIVIHVNTGTGNGIGTRTASLNVSSAAVNSITAISEPGTWAMLAGGFGVLVSIRRIRRQSVC